MASITIVINQYDDKNLICIVSAVCQVKIDVLVADVKVHTRTHTHTHTHTKIKNTNAYY